MDKVNVVIPKEMFTIGEFIQNNLPGIVAVNSSLKEFRYKNVFAWHLSIVVQLEELIENGMPSQNEIKLIDKFEDSLNVLVGNNANNKKNALFFARVTWNQTVELIWRVHNPEQVNFNLQELINSKKYQRVFNYRIDPDLEWNLTKWYLDNFTS